MKRLAFTAVAAAVLLQPALAQQVPYRHVDGEGSRYSHRHSRYPEGATRVGDPNPYEPKVGAPNPYATQGGTPNPYATRGGDPSTFDSRGGSPNPYATQGGAPAYVGRGASRR